MALIHNLYDTLSHALLRRSLVRGQSIQYMVPDPVVDYIKENPQLYPVSYRMVASTIMKFCLGQLKECM